MVAFQPVACIPYVAGRGGVGRPHVPPSPTGRLSSSPTRTASCSNASAPTTPPTRSFLTRATLNLPSADSQRAARQGRRSGPTTPRSARHRFRQPLRVRHAARRWAVRRRHPSYAHAHRRRVRQPHRSPQRLPRRGGARQDVHQLRRRHRCQPHQADCTRSLSTATRRTNPPNICAIRRVDSRSGSWV